MIPIGGFQYLILCQDPERVDDLFGGIGVGGLARHKVKKSVERNVASTVRIHDVHDTTEVGLTLAVAAYVVAQTDQTRSELVRIQAAGSILIEMVKRHPELV